MPEFNAIMPRPREIRESLSLKLDMGTPFLRFRLPADTEQCSINANGFTAWPRAHENRIDLGGFLACSVRSAMTRSARAVTATSASFLDFPYAITPGSSGTSANQRPSVSCSKRMVNCSPPSGGCGRVAMRSAPEVQDCEVGRIMLSPRANVNVNAAEWQTQVLSVFPVQ